MYLTKVVAASLLGDGCVRVPNDGSVNAQYLTSKTQPHTDYLDYLDERISTITKVNRHTYQPKMQNAKLCTVLRTGCHPFYTKFRGRMYGTGKKCVDPHYLTLLDWEFLAIWYQEDGTMNIRQRPRDRKPEIQISLATQCFSYGDHLLLKDALKEKLGLEWNVRNYKAKDGSRQYILCLLRSCAEHFCDSIESFIVESFKYKCIYDKPLTGKAEGDDIVGTIQECIEIGRNDQSHLEINE